jgi:hypothetical protein
LLIAALFHDADHSGGKLTDDKNVQIAKDFIKKFVSDEKIEVNLNNINELLDATQYPYVIEADDLDHFQLIIRDSDLMQIYEPNWLCQNVLGLSTELNVPFDKLVEGQEGFLKAVVFHTEFGKKLYNDRWDGVLDKVKLLKEVVKVK